MYLSSLRDWFKDRGYTHVDVKDDPSMTNETRQVLYAMGKSISWKVVSDSAVPVYIGTAYMSPWVVREINDVTTKVGELYEYHSSEGRRPTTS
jgi:hypothetical protein